MVLIIAISTGDFQIRLNVLSLSFGERESRNIVVEFHSYGHKMQVNDFFLVKAFVLSDNLDGAIISAIN